jgi:polynucleotide 5'-hydroxyl-kinase GRC3/NOL9
MFIRGGKQMNRTVEGGKTLLVDGPASVSVVSGRVEAFGFSMKDASRIVIREGKRLPLAVLETTNFDVSLGENAGAEEIDENTIPQSWIESFKMLRDFQRKPVIAMILGKVDSGKTSFCTYLINMLINEKQKVAILDGDLGQTDIGPPCTIAYAFVTMPVTDLFRLRAENAFFVGVTSPSEAIDKTIHGVALMKAQVLGKAADFVIVNTDGWVEGEEAVKYKSRLAELVNPDMVFCIQQKDELTPLLAALEKFRITTIESSLNAKQRSREKRRNLRELGYVKYLTDAKVKSWPLKMLATEEQNVMLIMLGEERGLLLGLFDSQRKFVGIGILLEVNYLRRTIKVFTPVSEKTSSIVLGKVRLDENLKEIPPISEETGTVAS